MILRTSKCSGSQCIPTHEWTETFSSIETDIGISYIYLATILCVINPVSNTLLKDIFAPKHWPHNSAQHSLLFDYLGQGDQGAKQHIFLNCLQATSGLSTNGENCIRRAISGSPLPAQDYRTQVTDPITTSHSAWQHFQSLDLSMVIVACFTIKGTLIGLNPLHFW